MTKTYLPEAAYSLAELARDLTYGMAVSLENGLNP